MEGKQENSSRQIGETSGQQMKIEREKGSVTLLLKVVMPCYGTVTDLGMIKEI